jgi:hypothetical protein
MLARVILSLCDVLPTTPDLPLETDCVVIGDDACAILLRETKRTLAACPAGEVGFPLYNCTASRCDGPIPQ